MGQPTYTIMQRTVLDPLMGYRFDVYRFGRRTIKLVYTDTDRKRCVDYIRHARAREACKAQKRKKAMQ